MSGLHLYRSNRLESLLGPFVVNLTRYAPRDPFVAARVVVGSKGMENWLRQGIADHVGVCANVEFCFPARLLADLRAQAWPEGTDGAQDPWAPDTLAWCLVPILRELADAESPLRAWSGALGEPGSPVGPDAWRLGRAVADAFDRYAWYRADWCAAWSEDRPVPALADAVAEPWQRRAWQALEKQIGPCGTVTAQRELPLRIAAIDTLPESLSHVSLFGVSALPPALLTALRALALRGRVDVYAPVASGHHWGDDIDPRYARTAAEREEARRQQPILNAFGRMGRDSQGMLSLDSLSSTAGAFEDEPPPGSNALRHIQVDIHRLAGPPAEGGNRVVLPLDRSVQVHVTHGPMRQVEVLRDALLHAFAEGSLEPREVVVLTPDPDTFAPLVMAAFARAPAIPVRLAGRSGGVLDPCTDVAVRLLGMVTGRVTHREVVDLLAVPAVRARFGLREDEFRAAAVTTHDAGIRWGIDGTDRVAHLHAAHEESSWRWGLDRILMGALAAEEPLDTPAWAGVAPWDDVEGDAARDLGTFANACAHVLAHVETLRGPRTARGSDGTQARPLPEWASTLERVTTALLDPDAAAEAGAGRGRRILRALANAAPPDASLAVHARTVRDVLVKLADPTPSEEERAAGGHVQVGALTPMRSVPARVVAVVGLDEGTFPRVREPVPWDLMTHARRTGDRDPRDEDRYLFLEAIMAARERLILTTTGRDAQTNARRAWASPLEEFVDALDRMYETSDGRPWGSTCIVPHPVAPWVGDVFSPSRGLAPGVPAPWSFDRALLEGVRAPRTEAPSTSLRGPVSGVKVPVEVDAHVLARWVSRPVERYAREVLGIQALYAHKDVATREPLELDVRSAAAQLLSMLRSPTLRAARATGDEAAEDSAYEQARAGVRARGFLPLGGPGDSAFAGQWNRTRAIAEHVSAYDAHPAHRLPIHHDANGTRILGVESDIRNGMLLHVTPYSLHSHTILAVWTRLLALSASSDGATSPVIEARLVGWKTDAPAGVVERILRAPEPAHARVLLAELVAMMREAHVEALPFTADAARALHEGNDLAKLWSGEDDRYPPSDDLRLVRQVLGEECPFLTPDGEPLERFVALVARTWVPLAAHTVEDAE